MKAIIWDIETTDMALLVNSYQLKNYVRYHNPDTIVRDWSILSAAWLDMDREKPTVVAVDPKDPFNDYKVVCKLHATLEDADILIGHNSDNFDYKKFNARAIVHDLPPISPKLTKDTLKMSRKYFKFSSNKLSYLCEYLGIALKDESPDWKKIKNGDAKEIRRMKKYNGQDCIATKALYLKLRSYDHVHINRNNPAVRDISGEIVMLCPECCSPDFRRKGARNLKSGRRRQRYRCNVCKSWWSGDLI